MSLLFLFKSRDSPKKKAPVKVKKSKAAKKQNLDELKKEIEFVSFS